MGFDGDLMGINGGLMGINGGLEHEFYVSIYWEQ